MWKPLKIPFINCKVESKLKWIKYCVLSVDGNENNINQDADDNNIIFTIKDIKSYVPIVTLSTKLLSKEFERSVHLNEYKLKSDIKRYVGIRKLIRGQGEEYTTGCLLDYDYIRNHYRLIAVGLTRQKELDADPKVIQPIEFIRQQKRQVLMIMLLMREIIINLCLS